MKFVNFSEEQEPLLVMEYLPLAHQDIKPENILVQSRSPFVIKLGDFGLAKNASTLRTFCRTKKYAAPEIWRRRYTAMVDIWSLGVVVFQYMYGLPKPTHLNEGEPWCRDIVTAAEEWKGDGDTLIDLISTKMLKMDYRRRQSASDCLEEVHRLGFHAIHNVEIGRTTPTRMTTGQDGVTRTISVVPQPRQNTQPDIEGASETTEINRSKRDLQERVHFYNLASPQSYGRHPKETYAASESSIRRQGHVNAE